MASYEDLQNELIEYYGVSLETTQQIIDLIKNEREKQTVGYFYVVNFNGVRVSESDMFSTEELARSHAIESFTVGFKSNFNFKVEIHRLINNGDGLVEDKLFSETVF